MCALEGWTCSPSNDMGTPLQHNIEAENTGLVEDNALPMVYF